MRREIWLPVRGFEGAYEVSSWGRVRSIDRWVKTKGKARRFIKGQILKPQIACGYAQVYFYVDGKQKWFKVHKLVADAFLPVPPYLYQQLALGEIGRIEINHKDENTLNCYVENLEWCSSKYNANWGSHRQKISQGLKNYYQKKRAS